MSTNEALNALLDRLEDTGKLDDPLEVLAGFEAWAESTGRPLYPHQLEAAEHLILENRHLIAPTPTGSGKSLIGVAGILWALARGGVAYYTAPLKALVSEKFFDLVDLFGAANVGMLTGDGAVNADAPIICATAEILANQALRWGEALEVDTVVMDEFHYYGDPERGWAWQAPLLLLPQARFVLMSATLGDTTFLQSDLHRRTGREVAVLDSAQRPVPLEMEYRVESIEKLLVELAHHDQLPAYLVHPSQRAAVEEATRIAGLDLDLGLDTAQRECLKAEVKAVGFHSAFGKTLRPLLLQGIGIHHAGMLPRYRRLVERLAGMGLLKLISGTDTLGVGINVPIRTVVMTSLVKFDGSKERHLNAREFHQVAGRAGRAGFDAVGYVFTLAPQWEVENAAALAKAGDDPKRRAKVKKKTAPEGRTTWSEGTFKRLVESEPGVLSPRWQITHAMVLNTLQRPGDQAENLRALAADNHNVARHGSEVQSRFEASLGEILDSLVTSGVIRGIPGTQATTAVEPSQGSGTSHHAKRFELTADLPETFALNQSLAPFALDYLQAFHPENAANPGMAPHAPGAETTPRTTPAAPEATSKEATATTTKPPETSGEITPQAFSEASPASDTGATPVDSGETSPETPGQTAAFGQVLDIISVVEAVLDDPPALLRAQERAAKDRVFAELKAAGADYEERQAALEKITYPRPLEAELAAAFEIYAQANPWAKGFRPMPKSIVRDMVETGATFTSYIAQLGSAFAEGQLLRYLSDAWRALTQIVPGELRVGRFEEVLEWLQDLIRRVDSSLLDEWKYLENPDLRAQASPEGGAGDTDGAERAFGQRADGSFEWVANPAAATSGLRRAVMPWLDALGGDEFELLARMETGLRARLAPHESAAASDAGSATGTGNTREAGTKLLQTPPVGEAGWDKMLGTYWDAHDFMDTGAEARNKRNFQVLTDPEELSHVNPRVTQLLLSATAPDSGGAANPGHPNADGEEPLWLGELTLVDGEQDLDFGFYLAIDPRVTLAADTDNPQPAWVPLGLWERF